MNVDFLPLLPVRTQACLQTDLRAVIAVRTKHHGAILPVKGEVGDLNGGEDTGAAKGLGRTREVWEVIGWRLQKRRGHQGNGRELLGKTENQRKCAGLWKVGANKR